MAVFIDLDDDDCAHSQSPLDPASTRHVVRQSVQRDQLKHLEEGGNDALHGNSPADNILVDVMSPPNKLAAALTCYPIAWSLSSSLDINDLHALASTCKSVHTSLTQYAQQLKAHSLRCVHDEIPMLTAALPEQAEATQIEYSLYDAFLPTGPAYVPQHLPAGGARDAGRQSQPEGLYTSMGVTSKISPCARDLVAPCRNCGTIICRNCTIKPPSNSKLKGRHRRLCRTCLEAPIEAHLQPIALKIDVVDGGARSSASSVKSARSFSGSSTSSGTDTLEMQVDEQEDQHTSTSIAFLRSPCTCESRGVFLCVPCGQNLTSADTTYQRVWTWRSRYSTHIGGGLGTGLGEGNQGQKCGRGEACLDKGGKAVCWVEIDCSEGTTEDREHDGHNLSRAGAPDYVNNKPGYLQQEIEGIGGVVKKKVKKRVKVGGTCWEYADERESGKYLEREAQGTIRSWCAWCNRLCLDEKDRASPIMMML
ncbi:hypothetical protein EDD37DRAFT_697722 [Exophiala viscosa]|uniref:Uncharacterized protein n=1 Tax=Exophiala viscosa TaxID=2486360 RepID=A0AAN6DME1_9EURO|nr:hypothetical protein EDD36DRAFT_65555 [Exophiala viscosa]KAI1620712.1 hypothetical protein EDD37DRAFT_697722 [Exophiala viscosa]